jgi:hypothetical protein
MLTDLIFPFSFSNWYRNTYKVSSFTPTFLHQSYNSFRNNYYPNPLISPKWIYAKYGIAKFIELKNLELRIGDFLSPFFQINSTKQERFFLKDIEFPEIIIGINNLSINPCGILDTKMIRYSGLASTRSMIETIYVLNSLYDQRNFSLTDYVSTSNRMYFAKGLIP